MYKLASRLTEEDKKEITRLDKEVAHALDSSGPFKAKDPQEILDEFYNQEIKRWQEAGFTKKDAERYFTEKYLSQLTLEDYLLLWSRFCSGMVTATHVTRQGIRDHTGIMEHIARQGEFCHGFEDILKDGSLRSAVSNIMMQENKELALANYLHDHVDLIRKHRNPGEGVTDLDIVKEVIATSKEGRNYPDMRAVHLGLEAVLDRFYGGETTNEIFFVVPMALIVNEYHLYKEGPPGQDTHNNLWIWDREHNGIPISASIVCIPAHAKVNPKTGSRYELDENDKPIINQENVTLLTNLVENEGFCRFVEQIREVMSSQQGYEKGQSIKPLHQELINRFGIKDNRLRNLIIYNDSVRQNIMVFYKKYSTISRAGDIATEILSNNACYYKLSENTIPSQEYWERYFKDHPDLKPNKVFYYTGSPNSAVRDLCRQHHLKKYNEPKVESLFPESYIQPDSGAAHAGEEDFSALTESVVNKYFTNKK